jgi:hypothetical protein
VYVDAIDATQGNQIAKVIQCWTNQCGTAVPVINELPLCWYR